MEPQKSFKLLNDIFAELDTIISNFDAYKVENVNDKLMVASGIPKANGKTTLSISRSSIYECVELSKTYIGYLNEISNL